MAPLRSSPLQWLCSLLLLASAASALKFELPSHGGAENHKKERCIRNFVGQETLVVVTATVDGYKGDGMTVNIHVREPPFSRRHRHARRDGCAQWLDRETHRDTERLTTGRWTTDSRRAGQRLRQGQGRRRRVEICLHVPRGRGV